ncbi:MAG: hypothetical protein ACI4I9_09630 [Porcipelethomonas sp.]
MEGYEIREHALRGAVITACSLFAQWVHWFVYEKTGISGGFLFFTPLVLCFMYSLVMSECGKNRSFGKGFVFVFSVIIPLALSFVLSAYMVLSYPDMSIFSADKEIKGTPREIIAIYSGRILLTSVYLLVYSAADALLIQRIMRFSEKKRQKQKLKGTE